MAGMKAGAEGRRGRWCCATAVRGCLFLAHQLPALPAAGGSASSRRTSAAMAALRALPNVASLRHPALTRRSRRHARCVTRSRTRCSAAMDWGMASCRGRDARHPAACAATFGGHSQFWRAARGPIAMMRAFRRRTLYIVYFQTPAWRRRWTRPSATRCRFFMRKKERHEGGEDRQAAGRATQPAWSRSWKADEGTWGGRARSALNVELNIFVDLPHQHGFTGGIKWYRNFTETGTSVPTAQKVECPG